MGVWGLGENQYGTTTLWVSKGCLKGVWEGVWNVSRRCLDGVWKVSGRLRLDQFGPFDPGRYQVVSECCLDSVWRVSGKCK